MADNLFLPDIPNSPMFVDDERIMTIEWQEFFRGIYDRVGETTSPTIVESDISSIAELYKTSKNYDKRINELEQQLAALIIPKSYDKEITNIITKDYIQTREPFKYFLPQTVWDDLRFPVGSVRGGGAFDTSPIAYKGSIVEAFSTGPNNESIQFIGQFPHSYKQDSEIEFHLHWTIPTSGAGVGAENVKWDFTYSWANINGSFPAESSATITVDIQNITADDHIVTDITGISGIGKGISSIIICSLTRDIGVANDYVDNAYFLEADFHFEIDTIGSRLEYDK